MSLVNYQFKKKWDIIQGARGRACFLQSFEVFPGNQEARSKALESYHYAWPQGCRQWRAERLAVGPPIAHLAPPHLVFGFHFDICLFEGANVRRAVVQSWEMGNYLKSRLKLERSQEEGILTLMSSEAPAQGQPSTDCCSQN